MSLILRSLIPYLLAAAIGGAGIWWVTDLRADLRRIEVENAQLVREAKTAKAIAEQARLARAVADANAARLLETAREYQNLKDTLKGVGDEPLPLWMVDYLGRLFPGTRR